MKQVDRQALELAMEQARREPDIAAQLDDKLHGTKLEDGKGWACRPECWQDVAKFAAYHLERRHRLASRTPRQGPGRDRDARATATW